MAAGMLPPCDMAVRTCRRGVWRQVYISQNFWFDHLFFKNQKYIYIYIKFRDGLMLTKQYGAASCPSKMDHTSETDSSEKIRITNSEFSATLNKLV
jgi:hypothetical protein